MRLHPLPARPGRGTDLAPAHCGGPTAARLVPGSARTVPVPARLPAGAVRVAPMTKWEYATVPLLAHATKQILDTWGADGWELVAVVPGMTPESLVAYLKRPLP